MPAPGSDTFRMSLTSFVLFCAALLLTAYSARNPSTSEMGGAIAAELITPFQIVSRGIQRSAENLWNHYVWLFHVAEENRHLKEKLSRLKSRNSELMEYQFENRRLQRLLGVLEAADFRGIGARIIGYNPSNWIRSVSANRGFKHGIKPGMAVISDDGVAGQVIKVSRYTSQVLLITDQVSGVDALVQRTRARGVVTGLEDQLCRLQYVLDEEDLKVGDRVITSGADGIYPKGLLIGIISRYARNGKGKFQTVEVRPSVDFSRLENVLIISGQKHRTD